MSFDQFPKEVERVDQTIRLTMPMLLYKSATVIQSEEDLVEAMAVRWCSRFDRASPTDYRLEFEAKKFRSDSLCISDLIDHLNSKFKVWLALFCCASVISMSNCFENAY